MSILQVHDKHKKRKNIKLNDEELADDNVPIVYKLNQDCLANIFKYLSVYDKLKVEQVCTRWSSASKLAWSDEKNLNFHKDYFTLNSKRTELSYLKQVLPRCSSYLVHLKFNTIPNSNQLSFFHQQHYQNIVKLDLKLNGYNGQPIEKIFLNMNNLKSITFKKMENISNKFLHTLQCLSSSIEEINLFCSPLISLCYFENTAGFTIEKFDSLHILTIHGYKLDRNIMNVIGEKNKLSHLNLSRCEINCRDSLREILNLKNLQVLKIRSVYTVDDLFLSHLVNNCKNLKHLNIAQCFKITDIGLIELSKLEKLDELTLNRISLKSVDITDKSIGKFKNMKKFQCCGCNHVSHEGIIKMIRNSPEIELLDVGQTGISAKILLPEASSITNNRSSKIVLKLKIDFLWKSDAADAQKFTSDFLIIDES